MTKQILLTLILFTLSTSLWAQGAIGHDGAGTNNTQPSSATGHDRDFNLTDEERNTADTFMHTDRSTRMMDEACNASPEALAVCNGEDPSVYSDSTDMLIQTVGQMYSMFAMISAVGGGSKAATETVTTTQDSVMGEPDLGQTTTTKELETCPDYCQFIPMVTEMSANVQQSTAQESLIDQASATGNEQADSLYKLARSHDERAKTAQMQSTGWGATSVCYVATLITCAAKPDTYVKPPAMMYVKMGAAIFLWDFYGKKVDAHESYARIAKGIGDMLPRAGDCNPITQRDCYCLEPTTKNDPRYCIPRSQRDYIAANTIRVTCTNSNGQPDNECRCKSDNSCYEQKFMYDIKKSGLGAASFNDTYQTLAQVTRGELSRGNLQSGAIRNAASKGKALLKENDKLFKPKQYLDKNQTAMAESLMKDGMPPRFAHMVAGQPLTEKGKAYIAGLSSTPKGRIKYAAYVPQKNLQYGKGAVRKSDSGEKKSKFNLLDQFKKKNAGPDAKSADVWQFAEKANQQAQINNDDSRNIFDIISRRYQVSGLRRLDFEQQ